MWLYQAAGDMVYGASATTVSRLVKPSVNSLFKSTSAPVISWLDSSQISGVHAKAKVDFNTTQAGGGSLVWINVTNSTLTINLTVTCTIVAIFSVTGFCDNTGEFGIRSVIDGTTSNYVNNQGPSIVGGRNENLFYVAYKTGVASGARSANLQFYSTSGSFTQGRHMIFAFVEP